VILLLDVGNTRMKWAGLERGQLGRGGSMAHPVGAPETRFHEAWDRWPRPDRVLVSNVVGREFAQALERWIQANWGAPVEFVRSQHAVLGVVNGYAEPAQLGADRWVGLIAAHTHYPGAACVIDCGTAITVDALTADGEHLGGLIVPGIAMMREALTKNLPEISGLSSGAPAEHVGLVGRSTAQGIDLGALHSAAGLMERIAARLDAQLGVRVRRLITGGAAPSVLPLLPAGYEHVPDLVFEGLALIAGDVS